MPISGAATPAPTNANVAARSYFQAARAGTELVVDGPFISRLTGQPIFSVVTSVYPDHDGSFRGIAVLNVSPEPSDRILAAARLARRQRQPGARGPNVLARFPDPPMASVDRPLHFSQIAMDNMRSAEFGQFDRTPSPIDGIARTRVSQASRIPALQSSAQLIAVTFVTEWLPSVLAFGMLALAAAVALFLTATRSSGVPAARKRRSGAPRTARQIIVRSMPERQSRCTPATEKGICTAVSDRWLELLGYERDEVIGHHITSFHTAASATIVTKEWRHAIAVGGERDSEYQLVRKSGEILDVVISAQIDRDALGTFRRVLAFVTDVTAQRRAEAALRQVAAS